jgi:cellulose biosynthesis protein BcsQ
MPILNEGRSILNSISPSQINNLIIAIQECKTEKDVEDKIIKPFLRLLGYSEEDFTQQALIGNKRVDFLSRNKPLSLHRLYLLIEVKSKQHSLPKFSIQIREYLQNSGTVFGLLTNGHEFIVFYNNCGVIQNIDQFSLQNIQANNSLIPALTYLSKRNCDKVLNFFVKNDRKLYSEITQALSEQFQLKVPRIHNGESLRSNGDTSKPMIITVFNNKGGVGKTTMTINLAAALNRLGKKVLLIDIDPQANLTTGLGIDPLEDVEKKGRKDIANLLLEAKTKVDQVLYFRRWNQVALDVIPSHIRLSDMEPDLLKTIDVDNVLAKKLKKCKDQYDFIFIDPPPSFGKVNTISLMASSGVLIPTQLAPYPIRALEYVMNRAFAIDDAREEPLPILGIAVSMYDKNTSKVNTEMSELIDSILNKDERRKEISVLPENTWIPNLSVVNTNALSGRPLCEAEFDDHLKKYQKEAVAKAFAHYEALAQHLSEKLLTVN